MRYNLSKDKMDEIYNLLKDRGFELKSESGICDAVRK
jgi:hypothetical protein